MKRITLLLAAGLLAACNEAPTGPHAIGRAVEPSFDLTSALSPGCYDLENNVLTNWDALYSATGFSGGFSAGEVVSISADFPVATLTPTPTAIVLVKSEPQPPEQWTTPFPGTVTYTVPVSGTYAFAWSVTPGAATFDVSCSLSANTPPIAADDAYTTDEDVPLVVAAPAGVLANDTDADGDPPTAVLATGPANGSLTLNGDGSFTYTPGPDFYGPDSFTYRAYDGLANSNLATVQITVHPVNDAPVAADDAYTTDEDVPLVVAAPHDVLANDDDIDGDLLTAVKITEPGNGVVTLNGDGSFTYTPDPGFYGEDSFTYGASDGQLDSNVATVSITVNRVIHATIVISPDRKDSPNTINPKSNGLMAVAILGDPAEFALTDIDWTTLAFGPSGAAAAHDLSNAATWSGHVMDVNGDGIPDLVTHYSQKATGIASGDTQACLTGVIDGVAIEACGVVIVR